MQHIVLLQHTPGNAPMNYRIVCTLRHMCAATASTSDSTRSGTASGCPAASATTSASSSWLARMSTCAAELGPPLCASVCEPPRTQHHCTHVLELKGKRGRRRGFVSILPGHHSCVAWVKRRAMLPWLPTHGPQAEERHSAIAIHREHAMFLMLHEDVCTYIHSLLTRVLPSPVPVHARRP